MQSGLEGTVASDEKTIQEATRRDIVDMLLMRDTPFHGRLDVVDFLKRVWSLDEMPSRDRRFRTASGDIEQHMSWGDWDESYLLTVRLGLLEEADEIFLRFVENVVHPMARADESEALAIATDINQHLGADGFRLAESGHVSGRPVFSALPSSLLRKEVEPTSWEKVNRQVEAMRAQMARAQSEDDYQSVGHRGRVVMTTLAQAVISPADAIGEDGKLPSNADASRLLDAYVGKALPGRGNEALRKAVRGVVQATSAVLHDGNATVGDAALITELVTASVQIMHILDKPAGRQHEGVG